jgi:hypothetical protein
MDVQEQAIFVFRRAEEKNSREWKDLGGADFKTCSSSWRLAHSWYTKPK